MAKISVIVPVYNVDKYLNECLESIINQTLKDIEIICINDGSTDNSLNILKEYQKKDDRIKVFSQENKGLGASRNVGMDNASGEYLIFIDSDDYFTNDALERLYDISKDNDVDFTLFKLLNFNNETREEYSIKYFDMPFLKKNIVFNCFDLGNKMFNISVTAPGKLFKRDFVDYFRFPENIIFEDTPFIVESLFRANKLFFVDEYYYMRRVRMDSITRSNFSRFSDCIEIFNMVDEICKKYGCFDQYKELLFSRKYLNIYTRFMQVDKVSKIEFFNKIKEDIQINQEFVDNKIDFNMVKPKAKHVYYSALNSRNCKDFLDNVNEFCNKNNKSFVRKIIDYFKF